MKDFKIKNCLPEKNSLKKSVAVISSDKEKKVPAVKKAGTKKSIEGFKFNARPDEFGNSSSLGSLKNLVLSEDSTTSFKFKPRPEKSGDSSTSESKKKKKVAIK